MQGRGSYGSAIHSSLFVTVSRMAARILSTFAAILLVVKMVRSLLEFPPNPEDAELWLPSDVLQECSTPERADFKPNINNATVHHCPSKHDVSYAGPFKTSDTSLGGEPNVKKVTKTLQNIFPNVTNYYGYVTPCIGGFEVVSGPFLPCSLLTQPKGFETKQTTYFSGKSEGTGVFLPCSNDQPSDCPIGETSVFVNPQVLATNENGTRGTGVFHIPQVLANNEKGEGIAVQSQGKKCFVVKDRGNKERSQLPYETSSLPQEWTY